MKLYSHDNKLLIDHLREVAENCIHFISGLTLFIDSPVKKQIIQDLAYLAGCFHDLGKGTRFFQHYLLNPEHEITGPKNHALISALFAKEIANEYLSKTSLSNFDKKLFPHLIFTAVKRHHGKLDKFEDELYISKYSQELLEQIISFEEDEIETIVSELSSRLSLKYSFKDFKKYILSQEYLHDMPDFFLDCFEEEFEELSKSEKLEHYYFHHLLFSTLLLADKTDVILDKRHTIHNNSVLYDKIEAFRKKNGFNHPKSVLDKIKNLAFTDSLVHLRHVFLPNRHIYSITLPTGLGKTITSFAVALELKRILGEPYRRLIVTIPFTSIIDQNFEVYRQITGSDHSSTLLKHHHLAEPHYKIKDDEVSNEKLTTNKSQFLIETWQSEIVVTTFVQLLNSVFSNDKSMLMKLPNLANSIIILDEIQTIPYEYWQLIKNTFEILGSAYNCYFIMMSATQPLIFLPQEEVIEIIPDYKKYFGYFNRTKLINKAKNAMSLADFITDIKSYLTKNTKKDILLILNTKKHSRQCLEALRNEISHENEEIYYLSTLITPFERKRIINCIRENSNKRKIIVSTQLIEAGVDISVDTVFRVMAPIDAIIQAAGRANRYAEKSSQGEVYLYEIEELKKATSLIYGSDLIQKTKNVLKEIDVIEESSYLSLIECYFKEVRKQSDTHTSIYLEGIYSLDFKKVGNFSLIEESKTESVFLQLNIQAKNIWEDYASIWQNPSLDSHQRKEEFSKIKSVFYDYVINVPIPRDKKAIDFDNEPIFGFYLSTLESPTKFYSYNETDFSFNTGYQEINVLSF